MEPTLRLTIHDATHNHHNTTHLPLGPPHSHDAAQLNAFDVRQRSQRTDGTPPGIESLRSDAAVMSAKIVANVSKSS